jgi:hypothetical protein
MHISRWKHKAEGVVGVPRELSKGSDSLLARQVRLEVIADRPMSAATELKSHLATYGLRKEMVRFL